MAELISQINHAIFGEREQSSDRSNGGLRQLTDFPYSTRHEKLKALYRRLEDKITQL